MPQHFAVVCAWSTVFRRLQCCIVITICSYSFTADTLVISRMNKKKIISGIFSFEVVAFLCLNLIKFMMRLTFLLSLSPRFPPFMIARVLLKPFTLEILAFLILNCDARVRLPACLHWFVGVRLISAQVWVKKKHTHNCNKTKSHLLFPVTWTLHPYKSHVVLHFQRYASFACCRLLCARLFFSLSLN